MFYFFAICCHTHYSRIYRRKGLEEIGDNGDGSYKDIYAKFAKSFIIMVSNGLENGDAQVFAFSPKLYAQYMNCFELYRVGKPIVFLVKNVGSVVMKTS
jgi:hypothetical protein